MLNVLLALVFVFIALGLITKTNKRYSYIMFTLGAITLIAREVMRSDFYMAVAMVLVFGYWVFREREAFIGPPEKRQWRKWPWY
jgi:hypothetical protein